MYSAMRLARTFEEKLAALYRQGKIFGAVYLGMGQEATSVGSVSQLQDSDLFSTVARNLSSWFYRGVEPKHVLARWFGKDQPPSNGRELGLFLADLKDPAVTITPIPKTGRNAVASCEVVYDDLRVDEADRVGEEGRGFWYLVDGLNAERILIASEALGVGKAALRRAVAYAKERIVFGRPIGKNQAIQHPLAESWMALEAANLMAFKAAWLYDNGKECGAEANSAKYLGARAAYTACERAILTHGGYGYAKEFHVERFLREVLIARIAPVSEQLILCYVAERVLGLPKSY